MARHLMERLNKPMSCDRFISLYYAPFDTQISQTICGEPVKSWYFVSRLFLRFENASVNHIHTSYVSHHTVLCYFLLLGNSVVLYLKSALAAFVICKYYLPTYEMKKSGWLGLASCNMWEELFFYKISKKVLQPSRIYMKRGVLE